MSKAVLISIRPKWCEKICNGEKTVEVRRTRPKLNTPFRVYIYCALPPKPKPGGKAESMRRCRRLVHDYLYKNTALGVIEREIGRSCDE